MVKSAEKQAKTIVNNKFAPHSNTQENDYLKAYQSMEYWENF